MPGTLILPGDRHAGTDRPPFAVLLVDDRPFVAESVRRLLRDEPGIGLVYCPDPFAALAVAEQADPAVILLDTVMPDMDGFTLCRFFRAHPRIRDKPVIMLASADEPPLKAQAFAAGADDCLVKLPDKIELVARLRYHAAAYLGKKAGGGANAALQAYRAVVDDLYGQVRALTRHDALTGLVNRRAFEEQCRDLWGLAMRNNLPISLIMMNLDGFASFNEYYGQPRADACLKEVAMLCRQKIRRPSDILARFTDDHFSALLPATHAEGAAHVAELLRSGVEQLDIQHGNSAEASRLTISLGVANGIPERGTNFAAFLKLAEDCLDRSKQSGRNRIHLAHMTGD